MGSGVICTLCSPDCECVVCSPTGREDADAALTAAYERYERAEEALYALLTELSTSEETE